MNENNEVIITKDTNVNDVPPIDDVVLEEPMVAAPDDGFLATEIEDEKEQEDVKLDKEIGESEMSEEVEKSEESKVEIIKKKHYHGGRFTV